MTTVETARGPVDTAQLGPTLMHEHVVTRSPGVQENWPHLWDRNAILDIAERKLADLYRRGIRSLVDLTTVDLGRDIDLIAAVARRSQVHIVVATGVWWMPQRYFSAHGVDAVAELFIRDITQGIGNSGVKAAIIKCATDTAGVTPVIDNVLRASARAQKATGVPISTHTWAAGRTGEHAAGDLRPGRRRPEPRHHRPQRRQRGPRLPARADGAREHDRDGPLRPGEFPAHRQAGRGGGPPLRRGLRRQDGALARRQLLDRHAVGGRQAQDAAALALQPHLRRHPPRACARPASRRTRSTRCWCAIRVRSSRRGSPRPEPCGAGAASAGHDLAPVSP